MRLGRPEYDYLSVGDLIDFWRVEKYTPDKYLCLVAKIKLTGKAWLEFEVKGNSVTSFIRQTITFNPFGIIGHAYWYALFPLYQLVFREMLHGIKMEAEDIVIKNSIKL